MAHIKTPFRNNKKVKNNLFQLERLQFLQQLTFLLNLFKLVQLQLFPFLLQGLEFCDLRQLVVHLPQLFHRFRIDVSVVRRSGLRRRRHVGRGGFLSVLLLLFSPLLVLERRLRRRVRRSRVRLLVLWQLVFVMKFEVGDDATSSGRPGRKNK